MRKLSVLICILVCALFVVPANASYIYSFEAITSNSIWRNDPGLIITMELFDVGSNQVEFKFQNSSTIAGAIAQIYFEQGPLQSLASINWGSQKAVEFTSGATPPNVPGSTAISTPFQVIFSVGANKQPPKNGLSSGEWLTVTFNLAPGKTFADVTSSINSQGGFRVGMHLVSLPDGNSEGFVNTVPEPATLAVLALGSAVLIPRRKKN
ncbi:MAG: hypothetical protein A2Y07_03940 [Planctomycetes bacterium GWF2_50_10]|nr:MAG: hypothetical protein A2Y07_03940 [Planctomycetes bacterium GWF2_50_10]